MYDDDGIDYDPGDDYLDDDDLEDSEAVHTDDYVWTAMVVLSTPSRRCRSRR